MLPLCLSYDHRAINGSDAGRFFTYLSSVSRRRNQSARGNCDDPARDRPGRSHANDRSG